MLGPGASHRLGINSCVDQPCVTGDRFVAGFAHQVIADAGAEVEAFTAF